ncbi:hypothetical protein TGDOM2_283540 [Toxoplasma gondii GAB2-2007-GAL-DOM2]|uniref:Uncharacterized protein n=6 Tax=Toxoplasma gondii TaxID=5811 RepID=S7UNI0_TOXGG|nr:hypothetical protein TGGT1_283540 [Toxoplasma gondii GT1]KAF4643973.1 hypothetical protein TGRH88_027290 [Toxoplasma gondii]KFG30091.1 hypothetical protein TGDOM2_283540 [Toxoplasma gondii GAB2-2007-GAL-DOM2]KFG33507.1 hypothetical protein TGFOU_283540 [Toxoplasma gondii FOU]PUA87875.1 hypothetical protein TGBR9_283540 [Toxoplasma gondii TgCATBr9]RQX67056.1 hypothetical protein TGCAST_283540 [Toxoplasma gondii CAST]
MHTKMMDGAKLYRRSMTTATTTGFFLLACWFLPSSCIQGSEALSTTATTQPISNVTRYPEQHTVARSAADVAKALAEKVAREAMKNAYNDVFRNWTGIAHPDFHNGDAETCKIVLSFDVAKKKNAMGSVTKILSVTVNNARGQLTVKYLERPNVRNATNVRRASSWVRRKLALETADEVVSVTETIDVPQACIADNHSRYFVVTRRKNVIDTRVFAVVIELELHPGPYLVPRDISRIAELDRILKEHERETFTEGKWVTLPGCMMLIRVRETLKRAPRLTIDAYRGSVQFREDELKSLGSQALPQGCTWDGPSAVGVVTRHDRSADANLWDVLLFMADAPSHVQFEYTLPKEADVERNSDLSSGFASGPGEQDDNI